jgi:RNA polymerase sigma factor (sigma-70 family)
MSDRLARIAWFKVEILPHEAALRRHLAGARMSPAEIDDLVAEAQTRAYASDNWMTIDNGRAYLFMIVKNLIVTAARRRKVVSLEAMADLDILGRADEQPRADAIVSAREELRCLQAAVEALPEKARYVFIRRRIDGIPADCVADEMSVGVSTIDKHLAKAMAAVTRAMAHHGHVSYNQKSVWLLRKQNC